MPKRTITNMRSTSATHSGPRASGRSWNSPWAGTSPQKICFTTRRTYTAVRKVPATAGKSHQECAERQAPRNVRNSATKPAVAGKPSEERPPRVNAVAIPGIIRPKPPILKISRECAFSYTRPTRAKKRPVMIPWANIWKTEPFSPASVSVAAPSMTIPMWETEE